MNINDAHEARGTALRRQIKTLRDEAGITQIAAAAAAGVRPSVLSRFENETGAGTTLRSLLAFIEVAAPGMTLAIVPLEESSQKSEGGG